MSDKDSNSSFCYYAKVLKLQYSVFIFLLIFDEMNSGCLKVEFLTLCNNFEMVK